MLTGRSAGQFQFSRGHTLDLVAGVVANRLGQHIGQKLHLDLVEFDVGEGSLLSKIRLGKYIGDRLFISYAKDISSTAYEAAMEFEVLPGVTLEASQIDEVDEDTRTNESANRLGVLEEGVVRREWKYKRATAVREYRAAVLLWSNFQKFSHFF